MAEILTHFLSEKVNKIRVLNNRRSLKSELFVTGGWDNEVCHLSIWRQKSSDVELAVQINHDGSIMDLQTVGPDLVVTGSSLGAVSLFKVFGEAQSLKLSNTWPSLHRYGNGAKAACNGTASRDAQVATVGEDGTVNLLDLVHPQSVRSLKSVDAASINAVTWLTQNEVVAVNSCGQLKQYDFRLPGRGLAKVFTVSGNWNCLHCVANHPSQSHVVTTAGQHGTLYVFDMRHNLLPATVLDAHNGNPVWEILFHPSHPDNLFTCSEEGSVWHWNGRSSGAGGDATGTSWLVMDASKHRVEVSDLLSMGGLTMQCSINSMSMFEDTDTLLCGTDNESICVIPGIALNG